MTIFPLSEGAFTVDRSKEFIPFNVEHDSLQDRSRGSLLVEIQPFLIITASDKILLDTGLGFKSQENEMQIHRILNQHGFAPGDITRVLLSHLHKDHSGGILLPDKKTPAFPNARYYINRKEWDLAMEGSSSYKPEDFKALSGPEFIEGNGRISDEVEFIFTGAHSPYHQAFKITSGGETAFFGGDVAPQLQQMKHRFRAKYDYHPEEAMELRQQWKEEGSKAGWNFLFYHDIKYPQHQF